jgi:molecular chaperone GrpE
VTGGNRVAVAKDIYFMKIESDNSLTTEPEAAGFTSEIPATELAAIQLELASQKDIHMRQTADFENFKRRSRDETTARAAAQKESLMQELLPVIDNLERAVAAVAPTDAPQLRQGVEMTLQQLRLLLRQHGVEPEESLGQVFDPRRHEAVSQSHDPAQAAHTILQVFQRGYRKSGQVFRPAKVSVNKPGEHDKAQPKPVHHAR